MGTSAGCGQHRRQNLGLNFNLGSRNVGFGNIGARQHVRFASSKVRRWAWPAWATWG